MEKIMEATILFRVSALGFGGLGTRALTVTRTVGADPSDVYR